MGYSDRINISTFKDKVFTKINQEPDKIIFETEAEDYKMYHDQDCCESVYVDDIAGDLNDLIGSPILLAEEVSSTEPDESVIATRKEAYEKRKAEALEHGRNFYDSDYQPNPRNGWKDESETWTFYKLSTIKGSVTIRWYGTSNGYYSESVEIEVIK